MKKKRFQHSICFSSVEDMPEAKGSVAFITDSAKVFKDDIDIAPITLSDGTQYMPWGGDNMMPYNILSMIEKDETLATCQMFNAEVCYGSGLVYNTDGCASSVKEEVEDFLLTNSLPSYFLGVCQDFKHFGWCVSVIILDNEGKRIVRLYRKEVCYCRFSPAKSDGRIEYVLYANWNKSLASINEVEKIPLLSFDNPWGDLQQRMQKKSSGRKFAVVCRVPTPDSTYYPIPYYAALFKGNWYNIKQLIGMAKEAKLKNSAPLKYHIEVSQRYWEGIFKRERITDIKKQQDRVVKEKQLIIDFLTGAENSMMWTSIGLMRARRAAIGPPTYRRLSIWSVLPCAYTPTSSALCRESRSLTTAGLTSVNSIPLLRRFKSRITICSLPCIASS